MATTHTQIGLDDDDNLMITIGGCGGECGADDYECYGE